MINKYTSGGFYMKTLTITLLAAIISLGNYAQSPENSEQIIQENLHQKTNPVTTRQDGVRNDHTFSGQFEEKPHILLSKVYPNPANELINFEFEFKRNIPDAKLVIYNLLGTIVKEVVIREKSGILKINTSDLVDGMYFYSLLIRNQPVITQKLIIRH
jgi:hypothetical protein